MGMQNQSTANSKPATVLVDRKISNERSANAEDANWRATLIAHHQFRLPVTSWMANADAWTAVRM
jgi:hypothetical protein